VKKYRILKCIYYDMVIYRVQKKSIFGFWYNYERFHNVKNGIYTNIDDARDSVLDKIHEVQKIVVESYSDSNSLVSIKEYK